MEILELLYDLLIDLFSNLKNDCLKLICVILSMTVFTVFWVIIVWGISYVVNLHVKNELHRNIVFFLALIIIFIAIYFILSIIVKMVKR